MRGPAVSNYVKIVRAVKRNAPRVSGRRRDTRIARGTCVPACATVYLVRVVINYVEIARAVKRNISRYRGMHGRRDTRIPRGTCVPACTAIDFVQA